MDHAAHSDEALAKYYNEVWLDQLIEEAFRLMKEKSSAGGLAADHAAAKLK